MADIRLLERTLGENVTWNKARIDFLAKFIIALVQVKTVSLVQISCVMSGRAKPDSHYKRCQRFLRFFDLPFAELASLVIKLLGLPSPFVISIDRTQWYLGETPLNILMLSLVDKGVAFPLLWMVLEKKGCCHTAQRITLLEKYLKLFGKGSISFVTADREFICNSVMRFLTGSNALFVLEIIERVDGERMKAAAHLVDVGEGQCACVRAVGEQHKDAFGRGIDPAACASEPKVTEAFGRKIVSGG